MLADPYYRSATYTDTVMPQQSEPLISTLIESDPGLADLVAKFVNNLPQLLAQIKTAYAEQDWPRFAHKVHDLKGMGGNFGFQRVSEVAARLEQAAKAGDHDAISPMLHELDLLYERILAGQSQMSADSRATG